MIFSSMQVELCGFLKILVNYISPSPPSLTSALAAIFSSVSRYMRFKSALFDCLWQWISRLLSSFSSISYQCRVGGATRFNFVPPSVLPVLIIYHSLSVLKLDSFCLESCVWWCSVLIILAIVGSTSVPTLQQITTVRPSFTGTPSLAYRKCFMPDGPSHLQMWRYGAFPWAWGFRLISRFLTHH